MLVPCFVGSLIFLLVWLLVHFNVWLLAFAIKVLTQKVQYRCDAFVTIVLAKALELRCILTKNSFKHRWRNCMRVHVPHLINKFGICHDQASFRAERILLLELINECESIFQEELRKLECVTETLQTWIHETSITQIVESHFSISAIARAALHTDLIELSISLCRTLWQMEVFISLLTLSLAVAHTFADAFYGQDVPLIAEFAVSDKDTAFILILEGKLRWADFYDNDFIMEVVVIDSQWRSHVRLHGVARELDAWIVFVFTI